MPKTLIIHPEDKSTTFLKIIYEAIPDDEKTVITEGVSYHDVLELIKTHDRVMMMGHGSPHGLFACDKFPGALNYIIGRDAVELLKEKENNVFIWCNADMFVKYHQLKGFYSGMFISEVGEAYYCGLPGVEQDDVDESNYGFVNILSKYVNEDKTVIYENVRKEYSVISELNPVALYNYNRLYLS